MNKNFILSTAVALGLLGCTTAKADEIPRCFSGPTRLDDSWQKWYATNNCPFTFKLYYSQRDTTGSVSQRGPAISPACSGRGLIVETFKENVVQFGSIEWQATGLKSCSRDQSANAPSPLPAPIQTPNAPSTRWNPTEFFDVENKTPDDFQADVQFCRQSAQRQSTQSQADQMWDQCMRARGNRTSQELQAVFDACSRQAIQNFMGRPKQAVYAYNMCVVSRGWGPVVAQTLKTMDSLKAAADQEAIELDRQHRAEVQQQIDQENARSQNNDNGGDAVGSFLQGLIGGMRAAPRPAAPSYAPSLPTYTPQGGNCRPPAQACR
jgi:hypothetical protein